MYWGVIDPEGGRSTNNILLQGRLKICDQFTDVFVCEWAAADQKGHRAVHWLLLSGAVVPQLQDMHRQRVPAGLGYPRVQVLQGGACVPVASGNVRSSRPLSRAVGAINLINMIHLSINNSNSLNKRTRA